MRPLTHRSICSSVEQIIKTFKRLICLLFFDVAQLKIPSSPRPQIFVLKGRYCTADRHLGRRRSKTQRRWSGYWCGAFLMEHVARRTDGDGGGLCASPRKKTHQGHRFYGHRTWFSFWYFNSRSPFSLTHGQLTVGQMLSCISQSSR